MIISKTFDFDAAHRLDRLPPSHKCYHLHGHTYRVEVEVTGPRMPVLDWIADYAIIAAAWKPIESALDHRLLNNIPGLEVPTTEVLAAWILRRLMVVSIGPARWVAVTVFESATTCCRATPDDLAEWASLATRPATGDDNG